MKNINNWSKLCMQKLFKQKQEKRHCPKHSVGAVIRQGNKYLTLYRKTYPTGLAFIAGHVEANETPKDALVREVKEESGIMVKDFKLLLHDTFPNLCKNGYSSHEWWVYRINKWDGLPDAREPDKHAFVKFMSFDNIKKYLARNDFDPAWQKYILPALNILNG